MMGKLNFYTGLLRDYFFHYLKTRLTYRMDFWVEVVSDLLFQGVSLFFVLVVFLHTDSIGGWSQAQILFIYGYFMIPNGIFSCFFNLWGFTERYIVKGEMDRILTRPTHNLIQLILENLDPSALVGAFAGIGIMVYAWFQLDIPFLWHDPFLLLLLVLGSVMVYAGVYISLLAISFYVDAPTGILQLVWNLQNYGRYPVTVYNKFMTVVLSWILPFAFVGFYPAAYFLDPVGWGVMALVTPLVGIGFLGLGMIVWYKGVNHYRGAGS